MRTKMGNAKGDRIGDAQRTQQEVNTVGGFVSIDVPVERSTASAAVLRALLLWPRIVLDEIKTVALFVVPAAAVGVAFSFEGFLHSLLALWGVYTSTHRLINTYKFGLSCIGMLACFLLTCSTHNRSLVSTHAVSFFLSAYFFTHPTRARAFYTRICTHILCDSIHTFSPCIGTVKARLDTPTPACLSV